VIEMLDSCEITREDLTESMESFKLPGIKRHSYSELDTKAKTSFTRKYNKAVHKAQGIVESTLGGALKKGKGKAAATATSTDETGLAPPSDAESEPEVEEDDDVSQFQKKPKATTATAKKKKTTATVAKGKRGATGSASKTPANKKHRN
jgi:replication factor C subunit 1